MDQVHQETGQLRDHIYKELRLLLHKAMKEFTEVTY